MREVGFLVDTSALAGLLRDPTVRKAWRKEVAAGALAVCPLTELEIMTSAQSKADGQAIRSLLDESYRWVLMPDGVFDRAMGVQDGRDFVQVAAVTGQKVQWLSDPGSID